MILFVSCVSIFLALFFFSISLFSGRSMEEKVARKRIRLLQDPAKNSAKYIRLEKRDRFSEVPFYDRFLRRVNPVKDLKIFVGQSGLPISVGALLLASALLALSLFLILTLLSFPGIAAVAIAGAVSALPFGWVATKRRKRFKQFSEAFPDAVSRMASSLRAGFSLQMAFEAVVEDSANLVAEEFKYVITELEVGQSFEEALKKMLERIDTPDLRLFISSVILQNESGGNLAELLDNLETTIRQRFELRRELEAATAQAKLSGWVLSFLPLFVGLFVFMIHRQYVLFFIHDPAGKALLWMSVIGQIIGFLSIRKIVQIDF